MPGQTTYSNRETRTSARARAAREASGATRGAARNVRRSMTAPGEEGGRLPASLGARGRAVKRLEARAGLLSRRADGERPFDARDVPLPVLHTHVQRSLRQFRDRLREFPLPHARRERL